MKNILMIGAGMSSKHLIDYLIDKAPTKGWFITVGDISPMTAQLRIGKSQNARAIWLDVTKAEDRQLAIMEADLVVSLLPAHLHLLISQDCSRRHKKLVTSSYVEREFFRLGDEARDASLIFLSEMVLAPGLDRISAQKSIDEILDKGGKINAFRSYSGGIMHPDYANNPWKHKLTWNPRNFVLAGQGTSQYLEDGRPKYIPYNRVFTQTKEIEIPTLGKFEVYANRDSLLNRSIYKIHNVQNVLRATIRYKGFCDAWNKLIRIGLTDGSYPIHDSENSTYYELMEAYLSKGKAGASFKERMAALLRTTPEDPVMDKLDWLGLFRRQKIGIPSATPALILETLLKEKWKMEEDDKDLVVIQNEFDYTLKGVKRQLKSVLIIEGENSVSTAMSKFIGIPMGIMVKRILDGEVTEFGTHVPVKKIHYEYMLQELKEYGIEIVDYHS